MRGLDALLLELADGLVEEAGGPEQGVRVEVERVELALPVEARLDGAGRIVATLPRGRLVTGFMVPPGRLRVSFTRGAP
ncbi:MAG: hypothetical protein ABIO70_15965 [Pseudomonadota bacterium]